MPINVKVKIEKKEQLKSDIFKYTIKSAEIAKEAKAGQFLEIKVNDGIELLLRRPISIFNIDKEHDYIEFIFQVKGKGTEILSKRNVGEELDIIGPLGYGTFEIKDYKKVAIIGGGIGTYPLYELAKQLKEKSDVTMYMGFRNKELVSLEKEFEQSCKKLVLTTDDGSYREKGYAIEYLKEDIKKEKPDIIFACGPLPMLKAIRELSINENIPCQISLEERMGCGIGACLGCAVKTAGSSKDEPKYIHVCKQGPVFWANEVEI